MRRVSLRWIASVLQVGVLVAVIASNSARRRSAYGMVPLGAGAFYDSVGVDTHLTFANTTYGEWPRLVAALQALGVKHLSDGAYGNPAPSWAGFNSLFDSRVELAASHGMRFAFEMGKPGYQGGSIDQLVSVMSGPLRNSIEAIEDPNEFDSSGPSDWATPLATYDRQLYAAAKASLSLRSLPVIGPSLVEHRSPQQLGDQQSSLDFGNIHPYTGGLAPTPAYTAEQLQRIRAVSGNKPVWATEVAYLVVLWRTASVWNITGRRAPSVPSSQVTLKLPDGTSAASADPITTDAFTPIPIANGQLHSNISADPIVIQLKTTANVPRRPCMA